MSDFTRMAAKLGYVVQGSHDKVTWVHLGSDADVMPYRYARIVPVDPRDARIAELTEALREAREFLCWESGDSRRDAVAPLLARIDRLLGGAG